MSDELSKDSPAPVLPLGYFEPGRDPWRPMLRGATWFTLLLNGYHLISYLVPLACYFWEQATFAKSLPHRIEGMPRVIAIPFAFAALIIFIGSVDMLKLIESGRRWVVGGSLTMMVIIPARDIFDAFYSHFTRHHWRYGQPYE